MMTDSKHMFMSFEDLDASSPTPGQSTDYLPSAGYFNINFKPLAEEFRRLLCGGSERLGCSFAVFLDGHLVAHLWGGYVDEKREGRWDEHTNTILFSCTKSLSSIILNYVLDRAKVSIHTKIIDFWPEYGQNGKEETTILHALNHQAGIPYTDCGPLNRDDVIDPKRMSRYFEEATPIWQPGTQTGYHALTYGFLLDQITRRIDSRKRGIAEILEEDIVKIYGIKDLSIGRSENDSLTSMATVVNPNEDELKKAENENRLAYQRYLLSYNDYNRNLYKQWSFIKIDDYNLRENQLCKMPSNMGIGSARGLAEVHSLVATKRILSKNFYDMVQGPLLVNEMDIINGYEENKGYGWQWTRNPWGEWTFGHSGHGGQNVKIDVKNRLAYAFVCNGLHVADADLVPTFARLQSKLYDCIENLKK